MRSITLVLLVFIYARVQGYAIEKWPFKLVDEYVNEVKGKVSRMEDTALHYEALETDFKNTSKWQKVSTQYDFIIVGGGTSGAILANRLSEVPEWKVLLLEAGPEETDATEIPKYWEKLQNTPYNWAFHTTPQNSTCHCMDEQRCQIPAGRSLGGTSAINSMVYTRGNQRDYDLWADLGHDGWCWSDAVDYFKKIEDVHFELYDRQFHHRGGAQHLEYPQYLTPLTDRTIEAAGECGIRPVDYNGRNQCGIGIAQLTTKHGKRVSTARAYLDPISHRENLDIKPSSYVTKILISPHVKEVKGVEYLDGDEVCTAHAEKEVILAAGAINTPKLLLLSGVGPKDECDRLGIRQIVELPVGHNLKVRPRFEGLNFIYDNSKHDGHDGYNDHNSYYEHDNENEHLVEYLKHGKGPLTGPGIETLAFVKTDISKGPDSYPDIEIQFSHKSRDTSSELRRKRHDYWKSLASQKSINIAVTLNHPKSTGWVKLHDTDPLHYPIVEPALLSDEEEHDLHSLLSGLNTAVKIAHTKSFEKLGVKVDETPVHGCEEYQFGTTGYWTCAIKYMTVPTSDVYGTAKMGKHGSHDEHGDNEGVVDNHLKVYGLERLRVADASVIPVCISGGLTAPTMMIGEKAADLIKQDWEVKFTEKH